ncbi:putative ELMO domain-containing protein [Dioscorea sansibarensis]
MGAERSHGYCVAIRTMPPCSIPRCSHASVSSDDSTSGSPRWLGRSLSCVCIKRKVAYERIGNNLTPVQVERLQRLKHRMEVYFDASRHEHQEALRALWSTTYPDQKLISLISDQWKQMGWQGRDPSTDFRVKVSINSFISFISVSHHVQLICLFNRGAGFISLENLLFFAKTFNASFQKLLNKQGGKRAAWEYPFAVAGVNITFMIMQMMDLQSSKPRTFIKTVFIQMLSEDEWAFDLLYCVAFMVMDKQWLDRNASYMEFNEVLRRTRQQLERELLLDDVMRIEDMPSYSLLSQS